MPYTIRFNSEEQIIEISITGVYNWEAAKPLIEETMEAIQKHECFLILVDAREISFEFSTSEIFNAPKTLTTLFQRTKIPIQQTKRAVVITPKLKDSRFFENVLMNRGHSMRLFHEITEAKEWLHQ